MTKEYIVKFIKDDNVTELVLRSHYTCIYGEYSGEGKSEFISAVEEGMADGSVKVISELPVNIATATSIDGVLGNPELRIIIIDEIAMLKDEYITKINKSKHLFIGISRGNPLKLDYPLSGIYNVVRDYTNDWFKIICCANDLPVLSKCSDCLIITESVENRSEHELLQQYFKEMKGACGRDKIEKLLRGTTESIQVFADLGAIGRAFTLLRKRCIQNPKIRFYPYQAFEQLLVESPLLCDLADCKSTVFDYKTFESYYEAVFEYILQKKNINFTHGNQLPQFILEASPELLFNSEVGRILYDYIKTRLSEEKVTLNRLIDFQSLPNHLPESIDASQQSTVTKSSSTIKDTDSFNK